MKFGPLIAESMAQMPALHPIVQDFQFHYNCFPKPYYSSTIFLGSWDLCPNSIIFCHYFCGEQSSLASIQTGETHKAFFQSVFLCSSLFLYAFGCFIRNIGVTCYRFLPPLFCFSTFRGGPTYAHLGLSGIHKKFLSFDLTQ